MRPVSGPESANRGLGRGFRGLFAADLFILTLFMAQFAGLIPAAVGFLDINADRGLAEMANYLKWTLTVLCLARAALGRRDAALAAAALIFLGILYDDANTVHERAALSLVPLLDLVPSYGLRADGLGQLVAFGVMAIAAAGIAGLGALLGRSFGRAVLLRMGVVWALLILAGVGVDALHEIVLTLPGTADNAALHLILSLVEEGGELILASLALALAYRVSRAPVADGRSG